MENQANLDQGFLHFHHLLGEKKLIFSSPPVYFGASFYSLNFQVERGVVRTLE